MYEGWKREKEKERRKEEWVGEREENLLEILLLFVRRKKRGYRPYFATSIDNCEYGH